MPTPADDPLVTRVALLEQAQKGLSDDVTEIKGDVKAIRQDVQHRPLTIGEKLQAAALVVAILVALLSTVGFILSAVAA